ncbi:MAG: Gfo/Idh/MocA family oxidoreductase [Planctomycetota bacterium]
MTLGVAVVGLGFMGRTHVDAYRAAHAAGFANRLVAVADRSADLSGARPGVKGNLERADTAPLFDAERVFVTRDVDEVFRHPDVDLVSIATHTASHVELALTALAASKHVLLEKPVALFATDVERLLEAEAAASSWVMPAMCMRFWPGWSWLKEAVASGEHGAVRSLVLRRLAFPPNWSPGFYRDAAANGGALMDLHVHDADLVRWLFGEPERVRSTGTLDHLTTFYEFPDGPPHVVAEAGWDHAPGYAFRMAYTAIFERATVEFELGHDPTWTLSADGERRVLSLPPETGYDLEVRHALDCAARGVRPAPTLAEAAGLAHMLDAERRSLATPGAQRGR